MFRNIALVDPMAASPTPHSENGNGQSARQRPLSDPISLQLKPYIEQQLRHFQNDEGEVGEMGALFQRYVDELRFICLTHSLSEAPEMRLTEEEVAIGSIIAKCSQTRWRNDRTQRMRLHSMMLARDIGDKLFEQLKDRDPTTGELRYGLSQAWLAWDFSVRNRTAFGANSFGLIALRAIFNTLELLGGLAIAELADGDSDEEETTNESEEYANLFI